MWSDSIKIFDPYNSILGHYGERARSWERWVEWRRANPYPKWWQFRKRKVWKKTADAILRGANNA